MLKLLSKSFVILFVFGFVSMKPASAMDARVKTVAITSAYGTVGGALLGVATLAFGNSGRSIAKGASLGLYAGILFGTYVVVSHSMRQNRNQGGQDDYYDDPNAIRGGPFGLIMSDEFNRVSYNPEPQDFSKDLSVQMNLVNFQF